jgi:hypothetical protein
VLWAGAKSAQNQHVWRKWSVGGNLWGEPEVVEHSREEISASVHWENARSALLNLKEIRFRRKTCARSAPGQHLEKVLKDMSSEGSVKHKEST